MIDTFILLILVAYILFFIGLLYSVKSLKQDTTKVEQHFKNLDISFKKIDEAFDRMSKGCDGLLKTLKKIK
jgi:hypothetical protein